MNEVSLPVAFVAGVFSFLSPCVLPLVPVYVAILAGAPASRPGRWLTLLHVLCFIAGFSLVFVGLGASAGLLGATAPVGLLKQIAGGLLIAFGLFLLASIKVPWLNYELRLQHRGGGVGYLRSFAVGGVFSLGWTPCVGPILGGILTLAWTSQTAWEGAYLLGIYSLGLGLPFVIFALLLENVRPIMRWLQQRGRVLSGFSGVLLVGVGVALLSNAFARILP